jgi:hypothetical protein
LALRREVAWVLGRIPVRRSAEILGNNIEADDPLLRYQVVRALNHLHATNPTLRKASGAIRNGIQAEARLYYEAFCVCQAIGGDDLDPAAALLVRAVRERMDQHLEILFRLLGLEYSQTEMQSAYLAFKTKDRRITAIEFLDNVLTRDEKSIILPLLEQSSTAEVLQSAENGSACRSRHDALRLLASQPDAWLKTCALQVITEIP